MSTDTNSHSIAKIKIIQDMTNIDEVKQLCKVLVEVIENNTKSSELGFKSTQGGDNA